MNTNTKKLTTNQICFIALFLALVCVSTLFFKIPIPLGYAHLGNGFIFLASVFLGNPGGILCAGIGSALADMLGGWYAWMLPTLIIKSLMGGVVSRIACGKENKPQLLSVKTALALLAGTVIMVFGYFVAGTILYGSLASGIAQIPGLVGEDLVGIVLFYIVGIGLEKTGIHKLLKH